MGYQRGRNSGITGIVDIAGTPQFTARIYGFTRALQATLIKRTGRGAAGRGKFRKGDEDGLLTIKGKVLGTGFPDPTNLRYANGTITIQFNTGKTIALPVEVVTSEITFTEGPTAVGKGMDPGEDDWNLIVTAQIAGTPVYSGWPGSQPAPVAPSPNTQETYEGLTKTYDSQGILTSATQRIECEIVGDSDSAEVTELVALVTAATAPIALLEIVHAQWESGRDSAGGAVVLTWALLNSAEDIEVKVNDSSRSPLSPWVDRVGVVIDSILTTSQEATNQWSSFQSQAYAIGLSVKDINKQKKLVIFEYLNAGIQFQGFSTGGSRRVKAVFTTGDYYIYLPKAIPMGTVGGNTQYYVQHRSVVLSSVVVRRFLVGRLTQGTNIPEFATQFGTVNAASFEGLDAGTARYAGCEFSTNTALSGTLNFPMFYSIESDTNGHFDYYGPCDEWFFTTASGQTLSDTPGLVKASFFPEINLAQLQPSDFSVFIT